ncbi:MULTISPECIES: hypothetical protein [unclassified Schlesneria]|uniref:hypothetical protein n=1 Tax=unclassified Schlesneria TaxID=2762017 RepID=UPI0035A02A8D
MKNSVGIQVTLCFSAAGATAFPSATGPNERLPSVAYETRRRRDRCIRDAQPGESSSRKTSRRGEFVHLAAEHGTN